MPDCNAIYDLEPSSTDKESEVISMMMFSKNNSSKVHTLIVE
jgi:hypothetical protein